MSHKPSTNPDTVSDCHSSGYTVESHKSTEEKLLVAAIDIGTTHSGYALSFISDYKSNPGKIIRSRFQTKSFGFPYKVPTSILLDKNKEFVAFGHEAEDEYSELKSEGDQNEYYYFRQFKMLVYEASTSVFGDKGIKDINGRPMNAITVFGATINFFKEHLLYKLYERVKEICDDDIHWVLTIPALWPVSAKQFMRKAAYVANIDDRQLSIVWEYEVAALYCQLFPTNKLQGAEGAKIDVASPGTKFMVLHLGGKTADITVHQRLVDGGLKELHEVIGGPWGSQMVEEEFHKLLKAIFGARVFEQFCEMNEIDMFYLLRIFRQNMKGSPDKIKFLIPSSLMETYDELGETISDALDRSPLKGQVRRMRDMIFINADTFTALFKPCADQIVNQVKAVLSKKDVSGTSVLLMVGEFSECVIIQEALRKALPNCNIFVPEDANLAVLKGAVIFGHTCS